MSGKLKLGVMSLGRTFSGGAAAQLAHGAAFRRISVE